MREHTLIPGFSTRFFFVQFGTRGGASIHKAIACKYFSNRICTVVEEWQRGYFCLGYIFSSTHFDLVTSRARKVLAALCSGFLRAIVTLMPETALVSFRTLAFFFPLVTNAFSSFNATHSLSILDHCSCLNSPVSGVKVSDLYSSSPFFSVFDNGTSSQLIFESFFSKPRMIVDWEVVELQLRNLLSFLSNHRIIAEIPPVFTNSWSTAFLQTSAWNCASILFVLSCEKSPCPCSSWNWSLFSLSFARMNSLRMISRVIKSSK